MTERHDGGSGMSPGRPGALLAAIVAVILTMSAGIYFGVSRAEDRPRSGASDRVPRDSSAAPASAGRWVASWAMAPAGAEPGTETHGYAQRSVRNVVHTSVGGTGARVTLSNLYGQRPLRITHASIAVADAPNDPSARPGTLRRLAFGGNSGVLIPAGEQVMSDAVRLPVPTDADMLVTTYTPLPSGPVTYHPHARQISYVAGGDRTGDPSGEDFTQQSPYWRYVTALDVLSNEADGTVAVLGDSLTDGVSSTMGANRRWPDVLAARLRDEDGAPRYGVVNLGISGNRVLSDGNGRPADNPSGLNRLRRDVLDRTGVQVVVIALGVNDILRTPHQTDTATIVEGLRELTRQAHARGLKVVGATLMPFGRFRGDDPSLEAARQSVNAEIRAGGVFDEVVDFDKAVRDPYAPRRLRGTYDSGDHLHPSDLGYRRMAEALDLDHLKGRAPAEL
ncbi:SGNH/GDSL hydrolase family protein [Streptomyces sp. NPDC058001]|uniref:SGNH/GDSL hydrolase family protein n=1 Tax=Streptomyces sp. NPDC058001 TaxID=3346300 RepID=UPI0036EAEF2D